MALSFLQGRWLVGERLRSRGKHPARKKTGSRAPLAALLGVLALTIAAPAAEPTLTLDLGGGVQLEMVLVKAGRFQQGSPSNEAGRKDDETPRDVTLTQDFYLGKYPVTRRQLDRFVQETRYRTEAESGPSGGFGFDGTKLVQRKEFTWRNPGFKQADDHPVTLVTYNDARAFADWLAKKARRRVSLPTEAQWEYACRAGTTTRFPNGDSDQNLKEIAWFKATAGNGTRPVGGKKPNRFGLYDMTGNVFEWCRDWYGPYTAGPVMDPEETRSNLSSPPRRVLRGGSWLREAKDCRSAARYRNTPGSRNADNGFRVLATVQPPPKEGALPGGLVLETHLLEPPRTVSPTEARPNDGSGVLGVFCLALAGGGTVIVLLILLGRGARRRSWPDGTPPGVVPRRLTSGSVSLTPRAVEDGFWLDAPGLVPGSAVRYRCRVAGESRTGTFTVAPGPRGQFVYTGGAPTEIAILEVITPGQTPPTPWVETWPSSPTPGIGPTHLRSQTTHPSPPIHPSPPAGPPAAY